MRCFTFAHGELTPGIKTTVSESGKRLVYLGMKGSYSRYYTVFFANKKKQPEVDSAGLVHFAYPTKWGYNVKIKGSDEVIEEEKVVLAKAYPSPTKILLRINTSTQSKHRINGRWQSRGGWPTTWVKAHGFSNGQKWVDDLVVMDDQDVILIVPAGAGRSERMIVRNDRGEISLLPEVEYLEIVKAHKKELREAKSRRESVVEAVAVSKQEVKTVETGVDSNLEKEKIEPDNKSEAPQGDKEGKAHQVKEEAVLHTEEGSTIGA